MARILRRDAEKLLAKVPEEHVFYLHDGRILRGVGELGEALKNMSDKTFVYHSNANKQDFSNWVKDIIGDERLARDLGKAPNRNQAAECVADRLSFLNSKLS